MAGFASAPAVSAVVRRGSKLIIPAPLPGQPAILPPPCAKCGAPADGKPVERTYYWHHPAIYLTILAGLLIYVIVALIVRKSMKVRVPLCAGHVQRRSIAVTLAWVLPLIGIADAFVLPQFNVDGGIVALLTVVLVLAGLVIWAVVASPIRPSFIDPTRGEFTGFCDDYVQQFPETVQLVAAVPSQRNPPPPPPIG